MKIMESEFEGYIVLVEKEDLNQPLNLPELKGDWSELPWEGVALRDGHYHAVYLTNNEFALEFLFPNAEWLPDDLRVNLENHRV